MDHAAARVSATAALDRFFASYYAKRPVTATFTGVHDGDRMLPDWSPEGLRANVDEMRAVRRTLDDAGREPDAAVSTYPDAVDLALADGFLEIQCAEHEGRHFYRRNPALWTGEAIFSIVSLVTRPFAPLDARLDSAVSRLSAIPAFLSTARRTLESTPAAWRERALVECEAADVLFASSLPRWLPESGASADVQGSVASALGPARDAFRGFTTWLRDDLPIDDEPYGAGEELLSLLIRRGHWCAAPIAELSAAAERALDAAHSGLEERIRDLGAASWAEVEARITTERPTAADYLPRFARVWQRFRRIADEHALVTWPDAPIRYAPIPVQTRVAAPRLYYLFYRSPAPFDPVDVYDYVVSPIDGLSEAEVDRRLAAANDCAIALNHVVHHGGLGHHVQNWYAYRAASRIGQVAAVDAASRIAMFCGGSLAEGWACYACDLMDEIGVLTPLERASVQHTRVRLAARVIVDLALHTGRMTLDEAADFFSARGLMPAATARAEAVKASMFPGTPLMYWLGTQAIHDLRRELHVTEPGGPTLRAFHDRFLSYGAIPVTLIARLMTKDVA
jgi:hypothetical protein